MEEIIMLIDLCFIFLILGTIVGIIGALVGFIATYKETTKPKKETPKPEAPKCPLCGADLIFPMLPGINALGYHAPDEPYKYPLPCSCKFAPKKPKEINSKGREAVNRMAEKLMKACKEDEKNYIITTEPLEKPLEVYTIGDMALKDLAYDLIATFKDTANEFTIPTKFIITEGDIKIYVKHNQYNNT